MPDVKAVKQIVADLEMIREIDLGSLDHFPQPDSPRFADFRVLIPYLRVMQEATAAITHETLDGTCANGGFCVFQSNTGWYHFRVPLLLLHHLLPET